jgi:membrane-bound serine protease (ClpP class)
MPDKYQSYMRSMMRATAEAHGKDSLGNWRRSPLIAEAMVDNRIVIPGIIDSTKTLTFTTLEAIKYHYCEGEAETIDDVLKYENIGSDYTLNSFKPTFLDKTKGVLTNSVLRGILIMLIIGGIWFELQSPGIGFPLGVAICAAVLYFAPLYVDGLAAYWEIILFVVGLALLIAEIFVIPGFGIAGISGIILMFLGLVFSLLGNTYFNFSTVGTSQIGTAVGTVTGGLVLAFAAVIFITWRMGGNGLMGKMSLKTSQETNEGYIGVPMEQTDLIGSVGNAITDLRPSGKVEIDGKIYDALSFNGQFIANNSKVEVVNYSTGQIGVKTISMKNEE